MTDLHLVSWNRPDMTDLVIRTIRRNTRPDTYRLVVLDNGSEPSTQEMLKNMQDNGLIDELIQLPDNIGLEAARQMLLEKTETPYFVCIDNDCLPPSDYLRLYDWLDRLLHLMEKFPDFAAISMLTQVMIGTGNIFEEADAIDKPYVEFPHPGGSFRIMNTEAVKAVGGWDRKAPNRGAEERYICGKLRDAGFNTGFATDIKCLHLFGVREQTKERWGYADGMSPEDTGHSDISHPALTNGDDMNEVVKYSGRELARRYFHVVRNHKG